jgi:hypothetical protein
VIAKIIFFKFLAKLQAKEASRQAAGPGAQEYCITPSSTLPKRSVTMSSA